MKIQCPCGAKYAFDVTPEMAHDPVRFMCPGCGVDLSGPINDLIRQELSGAAPVPPPAPAPQPVAAPVAPPPAVPASSAPRLSISRSTAHAAAPAAEAPASNAPQTCAKHRGEPIVEKCLICQKPLCPKCMEMFGYVCSPLCKAKADSHGINVPIYANQKSVREAKQWRKIGLMGAGVAAIFLGLVGLWIWYAWFGSVPHPVFSVRFEDQSAYNGDSYRTADNQIVFLHGRVLARYDIKSKKQVWQRELITQADIDAEFQRRKKELQEMINASRGSDFPVHVPLDSDLQKDSEVGLEMSQRLIVHDQNIWIEKDRKMVRYDWASGNPGQEISLTNHYDFGKVEGGEMVFVERNEFEQNVVTHVNLDSGESRVEEFGERVMATVGKDANPRVRRTTVGAAGAGRAQTGTGLPTNPTAEQKPMDPNKVAQEAQNLPYAAKVALPATLSNVRHQQQLFNEMKDGENGLATKGSGIAKLRYLDFEFVPSKYGNIQWTRRMVEEKFVEHNAMKAPPKKSVLDKAPSVTQTAEVANEILNEMQRDAGGDTVTEDVSRYQVTVHNPESKDTPDWTGEIIGSPAIQPQKTVTVVMGGKSIIVLDKSNKELWHADMGHSFPEHFGFEDADTEDLSRGAGPCVERGDTLYVFDEAALTAFDLANGNVRWRVPSVGIIGLFFDDLGAIYVNTTSADLESIKYSRQIDVTKKTSEVVMKVDCKSGKVLWAVEPGGFVSHVEGKFILCYASYQAPDDIDPDSLTTMPGQTGSLMSIRRLNPKTGDIMFDYAQKRAPLSIKFKGNTMEVVFRKEVQILKFLSF